MERPEFTNGDMPLSLDQLVARERWMMESGNWKGDHSVPSTGDHYRYMWRWDSTKAMVINARRDDPRRAMTELNTLLQFVDEDTGFIPNKIFATAEGKTWRDYPEAWNFNRRDIGTSYAQPPLEAWAAWEIYESFNRLGLSSEGQLNLAGTYDSLKRSYEYFATYRQNSPEDPLVGIVHPNETGRDSDEACKPWLAFSSKIISPQREWLEMQKFGYEIGKLGHSDRTDWDPTVVRQKYWVNDVMFNVLYAQNLRYMSDIAMELDRLSDDDDISEKYHDDAISFAKLAAQVDAAIREKMWDSDEQFFFNLDKDGRKIPVESVSGLFPLLLDDIDSEQMLSLVEALEDDSRFNTNFPIPSQSQRSRFYTPDPTGFRNKFTPQWSGPVWLDMNHLIVEEGLVKQAELFPEHRARLLGRAVYIAATAHTLLANEPRTMEYYSPNTGKGMRVADFMWSNIGLHFEKTKETLHRYSS